MENELQSQAADVTLTFEKEDLFPPEFDEPFITTNKIAGVDQVI